MNSADFERRPVKLQVESTIFNLSLRIINTLLRREHLLRSIALALPISCIYFTVLVVGILRVGPIEYMRFLQGNPYAEDRKKVADQLNESFEKIRAYDDQAFENHQELALQLSDILQNPERGKDLENALRLSQENQDAVRALLQLGNFYKDMASVNALTPQHHQLLLDLYSAVVLVMLDTKESLQKALEILEPLVQRKGLTPERLEALPRSIEPRIRLETLRYLTYITAQLGEGDKQQNYTEEAKKLRTQILKKGPKKTPSDIARDYRLQWYWIDLSDLIVNVKGSGSDRPEAERESKRNEVNSVFNTLLRGVGCAAPSGSGNQSCRFLSTRMLRHRNALKKDPQNQKDEINNEVNREMEELWNGYINRIPAEIKPPKRQA